jgi:S-adenosylmethionine-diacylglycerol 3-amino-3-carboxypropyl transferase
MMQSEFTSIALDQLRYSLVWEGSATLYQALQLQAHDHALIICGAGCNVLNTLLQAPASVTAIDLNPAQIQLLEFKCHLIRHHDHATLRALLGLDGPTAVAATWARVQPQLPAELQAQWQPFFAANPGGMLLAGRLEAYVTAFLPTLLPAQQGQLRELLQFDTVAAQQAYFAEVIEADGSFRRQFVEYFDQANLSKGRDPSLFRYAAESGGELFYRRLQQHLATQLVRDNFFSRFFFFGPEKLPEAILPPCYQASHHARLRAELPRLHTAGGEAAEFLLSDRRPAYQQGQLVEHLRVREPDGVRAGEPGAGRARPPAAAGVLEPAARPGP